ncbi:MAG: hypothetical protein CSB47_04375 [Proteobacteria bacterium]|nr:MAG: hypothetical protein CSB47_04375 [Pseudomonadota bacterium]
MNPVEELRDIHLPSEVSWWPLAPGWWGLMLVALLCLFLLFKWLRHVQKKKQTIAMIMNALDELEAEENLDDKAWLEKMSTLLRRVAINQHGRQVAAGLVGQDWLAYLDNSGKTEQFSKGEGKVLASSPYQPSAAFDRKALSVLVRNWLEIQAKAGGGNA